MNLHIGFHIQKLRLLRGYTQQYMATTLKISVSAYSDIEKKDENISLEYLNRIAKILKVSRHVIVEFNGDEMLDVYSQYKVSGERV